MIMKKLMKKIENGRNRKNRKNGLKAIMIRKHPNRLNYLNKTIQAIPK